MTRRARVAGISAGLLLWIVGAIAAQEPSLEERKLTDLPNPRMVPVNGGALHVQGIEAEGGRFWITGVERKERQGFLQLYNAADGRLIREVRVERGEMYHPGGVQKSGTRIWLPVAAYRREGPSVIEVRDAETLDLVSSFDCTDHIGCLATDGKRIIGGNWDSRKLYHWDMTGKLLEVKENPSPVAYQDLKLLSGRLVASGMSGKGAARIGVIEWLDPASLRPFSRITAGLTDKGASYMQEGMALHEGTLYLLPEDGPRRVFAFDAPRIP